MVLLRSVVAWGFLNFCMNVNCAVESDYCYRGNNNCVTPDHWPGHCQTGKRQSPIDIPVNSSDFANAAETDLLLSDCYFHSRDFTLKNNGLFVEGELQDGQKSRCTLTGSLLKNENYTLQELSFRWASYGSLDGSQHSLNKKKYAMELHMVHFKSIYIDAYQAAVSEKQDALTSLSILFQICMWDNPALEAIIQAFRNTTRAGSETEGSGLVLAKFLDINSKPKVPLMQYNGSTTIPNCTETVVWNVFKDPQCISLLQLDAFRRLSGEDGKLLGDNYRPDQSRNNRRIDYIHTSVMDGPQNGGRPNGPNIFRPFTFIADWLRLL